MNSKHGDVQAVPSPTSEVKSAYYSIPLGGPYVTLTLEVLLVAWFDIS